MPTSALTPVPLPTQAEGCTTTKDLEMQVNACASDLVSNSNEEWSSILRMAKPPVVDEDSTDFDEEALALFLGELDAMGMHHPSSPFQPETTPDLLPFRDISEIEAELMDTKAAAEEDIARCVDLQQKIDDVQALLRDVEMKASAAINTYKEELRPIAQRARRGSSRVEELTNEFVTTAKSYDDICPVSRLRNNTKLRCAECRAGNRSTTSCITSIGSDGACARCKRNGHKCTPTLVGVTKPKHYATRRCKQCIGKKRLISVCKPSPSGNACAQCLESGIVCRP